MLYQATVPVRREFDRYEGHMIAEMRGQKGNVSFLRWGFNLFGLVEMRSRVAIDGAWEELPLPKVGSIIRYKMDAHVRRSSVGVDGVKRRVSDDDYISNLNWWGWRAHHRAGLELLRTDFDPITAVIKRMPKPDETTGEMVEAEPFIMQASRFRGTARIFDMEMFEEILVRGVGNAKAWGFGFIIYTVIEEGRA